jgi:nicotinamide N-methyltransferase
MASFSNNPNPPTYEESAKNTVVASNTKLITLKQLNILFSKIAPVEIIYRTPDKSKAHIVFKNKSSCQKALSLNGTFIKPDTSISADVDGFQPKEITVKILSDITSTATNNTTTTSATTSNSNETKAISEYSEGSSDDGDYDIGALLFDDPANCHGDPGKPYKYKWPHNTTKLIPITDTPPSIQVKVPVSIEQGDLMAHWIWESSIKMADLIATGIIPVQNLHVLEVGAGAGLPAIISAHCGAKYVISTDYPEPTVIDALRNNLKENTTKEQATQVMGHSWGTNDVGTMSDHFPSPKIDIILAADTLWLHEQHQNLFDTLESCLTHVGSTVYLTYQHHNEHAPAFFTLVEKNSNSNNNSNEYKIEHVDQYGWGGRELDEFDMDDNEKMGPIFLSTITKVA